MEGNKKSWVKWIIIIAILIICICAGIIAGKSKYIKAVVLEKGLVVKNLKNAFIQENQTYAELETYNLVTKKNLWCIATDSEYAPDFDENWQEIIDNKCNVKISNEDKYIYIRDNEEVGEKISIADFISEIVELKFNNEEIKIIKDEVKEIEPIIYYVGDVNKQLTYSVEDENVAKIEDNKIIGVNDGITKVTVTDNYGHSATINVQVTSLISLPEINNKKPYISNKQYTTEEAKILDDYLFYQIDEAGYKTRAGVVAAARFLSLELKYRIPYFIENGRITHFNHQRPYCDGEGRYYHRGLYLSEDKFADIEKSVAGPAMWGAYIMEWSEDNGVIRNGLDCSGFVCWCLLNGGFDFGDIGGGLSEGLPTLSDRGVSQKITMELLESRTVKAGDLIGYDGHIGIIIGVEDGYVYVADTLFHSKGLVATKFSYRELVNSYFTHIYDYTDEYVEEGNYTEMW